MLYKKKNTRPGFVPLTIVCFLIVMVGGRFLWESALVSELSSNGLSASSRMINSIFAAVITAMSLIITLASNLYTPGLVKIFVRHPVVIVGLSYIVGTNFVLILASLFSQDNEYYMLVTHVAVVLACIAVAGVIPFLYYVSQFLRPSYFLPILFQSVSNSHQDLVNGYDSQKNYRRTFDTIDTIANISLTASKRDDRQLMSLVSDVLHKCFMTILESPRDIKWRKDFFRSKPGYSEEVKRFFSANSAWPEAYVFTVFSNILKSVSSHQNEVINETCENLLISLEKSVKDNLKLVAEMHIMFFNRMNEVAIENRDYERIQSLSQFFIAATKIVKDDKDLLELSFVSWFHYARDTYEKDIHFGYETYLYDSGNLILEFAQQSEESSCRIFNSYVKSFWHDSIADTGKHEMVAYKVAVKTYWETKSLGLDTISKLIQEEFLTNDSHHRLILKEILKYKSPLHWSFSDRVLRFNYLPTSARKSAKKYVEVVDNA